MDHQKEGGPKAPLEKLRASLHPVALARPPEATWADGSLVSGPGRYLRLGKSDGPLPIGFKPYVPEVFKKKDGKNLKPTGNVVRSNLFETVRRKNSEEDEQSSGG